MSYITARKASEQTGYTQQHIAWLIREDRIKGEKFGQAWMVDEGSLLEYLEDARNSGDKRFGPRKN